MLLSLKSISKPHLVIGVAHILAPLSYQNASVNHISQAVESSCRVRPACQLPRSLGPLPDTLQKIGGLGPIPTLGDVGLTFREQV